MRREWNPDRINWQWVLAAEIDPSRPFLFALGVAIGMSVGSLTNNIWVGVGLLGTALAVAVVEYAWATGRRYAQERARLNVYRDRARPR